MTEYVALKIKDQRQMSAKFNHFYGWP